MFKNSFRFLKLFKLLTVATFSVLFVSGCGTLHSKTPDSSFAQLPICTNNQFLQKYNCDTINIQQAATSGDPDAQYALGYLYYYGIGLAQDDQAALIWIRKAAAQDQPLAKQALLIMEKSNTPGRASVVTHSMSPPPNTYTEVTPGTNPTMSPTNPPMSSSPPPTVIDNTSPNTINTMNTNNGNMSSVNTQQQPPIQTQPIAPSTGPINSQLPSYNQSSGTQQPAIDMLQSSDNTGKSSQNLASHSMNMAVNDETTATTDVAVNHLQNNISDSSISSPTSSTSTGTTHDHPLTPDERYLLIADPKMYSK